MFGQFGFGEMLLLICVGLFVFGPERLPTIMRDAGKMIRHVRDTARGMRDDLQAELGPELGDLDLASLHPKNIVENLLGEDDADEKPVQRRNGSAAQSLHKKTSSAAAAASNDAAASTGTPASTATPPAAAAPSLEKTPAAPAARAESTPYDADAT